MTEEQLGLLDQITKIGGPLNEGECEALKAILAEREELLDGVQEARAFIYEHLGSGWAVGEMLEALSRKANGGP